MNEFEQFARGVLVGLLAILVNQLLPSRPPVTGVWRLVSVIFAIFLLAAILAMKQTAGALGAVSVVALGGRDLISWLCESTRRAITAFMAKKSRSMVSKDQPSTHLER
jgi:hypothetical protein